MNEATDNAVEFQLTSLEQVVLGKRMGAAVADLAEILGATRVFIVASKTLSDKSDEIRGLKDALGDRCVGHFSDVGEHTPRANAVAAANRAGEVEPDLLVSVGGGSIIDATKIVQLCLNHGIDSEQGLVDFKRAREGKPLRRPDDRRALIRQVAVPTTLSGAEFGNSAGVLDVAASRKEGYTDADMCPVAVVYDPAASTYTPQRLWLSSAIRSLDHAIEGYCAQESIPYLEPQFLHAMSLFSQGLPATHGDPGDLQARLTSQYATWLACCGLRHVVHGASHGIGYKLGAQCGVSHGITSCVMLHAVLKWNEGVNGARQRAVSRALGSPERSAGELVQELVSGLGLPTRLRDVGATHDDLPKIAETAAEHPVVRANPRPVQRPQDVMEILELAW